MMGSGCMSCCWPTLPRCGQSVPAVAAGRDAPYVGPLVEFFSTRTCTVVRDRKMELARAIQAADFPDKLIYFACHGRVAGGDGTAAGQARNPPESAGVEHEIALR